MALSRAPSSRWPEAVGLAAICAAGLGLTTTTASVRAADVGDEPVMTMYVPLAEQEISDGLFSIYPAGAAGAADVVSTIAITSAADDALIYWDHWEDGFEPVVTAPASASTEVWGDEDLSNGAAPGVTSAADDVIDLGTVIFIENTVELPRDPARIFFDGGDKISASRGISMSRGGWDSGLGEAHAGAVAATDTSKFGSRFEIPLGVDAGFSAFDYTGMSVQVGADDTTVAIDLGGDGSVDQTVVRDEGESVFVDGGVTVGTVVTTSAPSQVHLITGRTNSRYEGRWYEVFPAETLGDEYVAAAGSFSATQLVTIFLYNPNDDAIDIDATTTAGTSTIPVASGDVVAIDLPNGSGGRFSSPGNPFSAVSGTVARTGSTAAFDWGYSLVPTRLLTPTVFVGWGAGNPGTTASNSPVWVAPLADTTVFVDRDADGTADEAIAAAALASVRVVDPDHDLTGARIFTTDGTPISVAWGQDAAIQQSNAYDLGTAILPTAALVASKSATLVDDVNGDGLVDPGDALAYTIEVADAGALSLTGVTVTDDLVASLAYEPGSTTLDGVPVDDATTGTPNPLDESGLSIADLAPGDTATITFRARLRDAFPFGVDRVGNSVVVTSDQATSTASVITAVAPILPASISGTIWFDADADGTVEPGESGVDGATVTITGPSHPTGTTTSTSAGAYAFGDLAPGEYTLTVDRAGSGPIPPTAISSTGGDTLTVSIASADTRDSVDFGYVRAASVSGSVFDDLDVDDRRDATEPGFSGVDVTITGPGLPPTGVSGTTSSTGAFTFSGLGAGTYTITATPASGDLPAAHIRTGGTRTVTVAADDHATGIDLGFHDPTPTAVADSYTTDIGRALIVDDPALGVLANDLEGNPPNEVVDADAASRAGGTVSVAPDGTFTYAPPTNFTGEDSFSYTISDASGDRSVAVVTVSVVVPGSISGAVWHDVDADGRFDPGERVLAGVVVESGDCAGDPGEPSDAATVRTGADGRFTFDGQAPGCHRISIDGGDVPSELATATFDADGGFDGSAEIVLLGGGDRDDVDFGFVNVVPDAVPDLVATDEGRPVTFDPRVNDADPEGRPLDVTFVSTPGDGTVTTDGSTVTYTPAAGFDGIDVVVYTVCDPGGECSTATATVTVANTNDPPRLRTGSSALSVTIGRPVAPLDVVDDEGDAITVRLVGGNLPAGITLRSDGSFAGVPTAGRVRPGSTSTFELELCDSQGACQTVSVRMTARAAPGGQSIPNSGANSGPIVPAAVGILVVGGFLSMGSRRWTNGGPA